MTNDVTIQPDEVDRWLGEHAHKARVLPDLVGRVAASLHHAVDGADLAGNLDRLAAEFARHVARDEAPGEFLDDTLNRAPRFAHEIAALRDEHHVIIDDIERARTAIAEVTALTAQVRAHIDRANRLAWRVANEESGEGD